MQLGSDTNSGSEHTKCVGDLSPDRSDDSVRLTTGRSSLRGVHALQSAAQQVWHTAAAVERSATEDGCDAACDRCEPTTCLGDLSSDRSDDSVQLTTGRSSLRGGHALQSAAEEVWHKVAAVERSATENGCDAECDRADPLGGTFADRLDSILQWTARRSGMQVDSDWRSIAERADTAGSVPVSLDSDAETRATWDAMRRRHHPEGRAAPGLAEGTQRALAAAHALTHVCEAAGCGALVHSQSARRLALADGSTVFRPGDG